MKQSMYCFKKTVNHMEIEAERSEVQGYPWFHRQFETNPGHVSIKYKKFLDKNPKKKTTEFT